LLRYALGVAAPKHHMPWVIDQRATGDLCMAISIIWSIFAEGPAFTSAITAPRCASGTLAK